jgi:hypothetical protein
MNFIDEQPIVIKNEKLRIKNILAAYTREELCSCEGVALLNLERECNSL